MPEPSPEFHEFNKKIPKQSGGSLSYARLDVRDAFDVEEVVSQIAANHQRLDGLVAAAGINTITPALEYTSAGITEMMDINYKGVYLSAQATAKQMLKYKTPGAMMLVASMSGLIANRKLYCSVYNSSKAAVIQLARSLAMEWGQIIDGKPIRVNALCPGNILTPMVEKIFEEDPATEEFWKQGNMMGRIATPEEFRGAALFLMSEASSFMTGAHLGKSFSMSTLATCCLRENHSDRWRIYRVVR